MKEDQLRILQEREIRGTWLGGCSAMELVAIVPALEGFENAASFVFWAIG
jgi:hypothetical protein